MGRFNAFLICAVMFVCAAQAGADEWVQVLSGGNGLAARSQPDAMVIYRGHVYVTSAESIGGVNRAHIFRATLREDARWIEISPSWGTSGQVTDMIVFQDQLYASNFSGQVWRLDAAAVWHPLAPGWSGASPVHALGILNPSAGRALLCAARDHVELWCGSADSGWQRLSIPAELESDSTIQSARLKSLGNELYLGIGGGSAGSRTCEVWKFTGISVDAAHRISGAWSALSDNCFGSSGLTWLSSMETFIPVATPMLFMGTGGHDDPAVVYKTNGVSLEDASPRDLYDFTNPFSSRPVRYGSMAKAGRKLYAGTRTTSIERRGADVIVTNDGVTWNHSNTPGFGVTGNDTVSTLAGYEAYLYAGVLNLDGFQVWRRNPFISESLPDSLAHYKRIAKFTAKLRPCLSPFNPDCAPNLSPFSVDLDAIDLAFLRSKFKDQQVWKDSLSSLSKAKTELATAERLLDQAKQQSKKEEAQKLADECLFHIDQSLDLIRGVLLAVSGK